MQLRRVASTVGACNRAFSTPHQAGGSATSRSRSPDTDGCEVLSQLSMSRSGVLLPSTGAWTPRTAKNPHSVFGQSTPSTEELKQHRLSLAVSPRRSFSPTLGLTPRSVPGWVDKDHHPNGTDGAQLTPRVRSAFYKTASSPAASTRADSEAEVETRTDSSSDGQLQGWRSPSGVSVSVTPAAGGAPSARIRLVAGASSLRGRKAAFPGWPNQDVHLVVPLGNQFMLVGVFDGHGREGHRSAARACTIFKDNARDLKSRTGEALAEALTRLCFIAQDTLEREGLAYYSGTTATIALIDSSMGIATVAHVGDSTLVITNGAEVEASTIDHRVDEAVERRVIAHGGEVRTQQGSAVRRIFAPGSDFPGLSMGRALGDQEAQKLGARCEPELTVLPFRPGNCLIVASDGVWDELPAQAAAAHIATTAAVSGTSSAAILASGIVSEARRRYSSGGDVDDITAVVVQQVPEVAASVPCERGPDTFRLGVAGA